MPQTDTDSPYEELAIAIEKKLFPQIISMTQWRAAQKLIIPHRAIKHRYAPSCAMLFTGQMFCECGSKMQACGGRCSFYYYCKGAYHGKTDCKHIRGGDAFLVEDYEKRFLIELCGLSDLVPRGRPTTTRKLEEQQAKAEDRIKRLTRNRNLLTSGELDTETAATVREYNREIIQRRAEIEELAGQIADVKSPISRSDEIWQFVKAHMKMLSDLDGRQVVREKLLGIKYEIKLDTKLGGFTINVEGSKKDGFVPFVRPLVRIGKQSRRVPRGKRQVIDGVERTYQGSGWWKAKNGSLIRIASNPDAPHPPGFSVVVKGKTYYHVRGGWYRDLPAENQDPD